MAVLVRTMTLDDVPGGLALSGQAGWNQLEADWRRVVELQPDGCFVAEIDGRVVGTVASCPFGAVAWVAMMLVDDSLRRRGIGRALMERVLAFLEDAGVPTIRLDATPLGRPLYESLGFRDDATVLRYQGAPVPVGGPTDVAPTPADDLAEVAALDRLATGADRTAFLRRLTDEYPDALRVVTRDGLVAGFSLERPGARALQIGPCIGDRGTGPLLLAAALGRHAGRPVIVDVPESHAAARGLAEAAGLTVARTLARMTLGTPVPERLDAIWASSGPERG